MALNSLPSNANAEGLDVNDNAGSQIATNEDAVQEEDEEESDEEQPKGEI